MATGSERTVADYLFAEVLERQPEETRRLLLRTSILKRVNDALGNLLTGVTGSQRILQELERENAFVVSLDVSRSWFRYHRLFADLLRLELKRTEPEALPDLHRTAAAWYEAQGDVVGAARHALAAKDWSFASRLLVDHSFGLWLDGRGVTTHALLAEFPADIVSANPELARLFAGGAAWRGSPSDAEAFLALAERHASAVTDERRPYFEVEMGLTRLMLADRRGDPGSALAEMRTLLAADRPVVGEVGLGDDVRAAALMHLGIAELGSTGLEEAERHLGQGLDLARLGGHPYLEVQCLAHLAVAAQRGSPARARELALEAVAIAEAHGWGADRIAAVAFVVLGNVDIWQGRFGDAENWLERAERLIRPDLEPAKGLLLHVARGRLYAARGRYEEAVTALRAAAHLEALLVAPQLTTISPRILLAQAQVQLGDTAAARATLGELHEEERDAGTSRATLAYARLAEGEAEAAVEVLAPVLDGSFPSIPMLLVEPFVLDAIARDLLGEAQAAEAAVERALDLAEPDGLIWPFVVTPARELLARHPRHRTAHGALLKDILDVLGGSSPSARAGEPTPLRQDLSESEVRVLRFLPSNLTASEIGRELYLSSHTVKTHMRHMYAKLGVHRRTEAVECARKLGLLGPSSRLR